MNAQALQEEHQHRSKSSFASRERPSLPIVPPIGMKAAFEATKNTLDQPIPRIAQNLGRNVQELTSFDVLMFTYINIPVAVSNAAFAAIHEQAEAWQSIMSSVEAHHPFLQQK
jgi:hypothetical protein